MASVVIMMGSKSDLPHAQSIVDVLDAFGISSEVRVASAHKSARHVLGMLAAYEEEPGPRVIITIAGRSNALGGMVDANTTWPVITCPPVSSTFAGADIYSSLRMPSGVAPLLVLEPSGAALAAAKILALGDSELRERLRAYQSDLTDTIVTDDQEVRADSHAARDS
jgi:5-(carboxyamino)imidazole ribonucleotide mutase